jgi:HD-GYP domain-containing protein (c-di-GMP phosphodiesterase class II)
MSRQRLLTQPGVGGATSAIALAALAVVWGGGGGAPPLPLLLLGIGLAAGIVVAYQYPIHIHYRLKIEMYTVPVYLATVLLPLPWAALMAGAGVLTAEVSVRRRRGTYLSEMLTQTGRLVIAVVVAGCVTAQLGALGAGSFVALVAGALALWAMESVTVPLLLAPITEEPAGQIVRTYLRESAAAEGAQYMLGLLGALAALQQPPALLLLALPTALVYRAFKAAKETHDGTYQLLESMADAVDLRDAYTGGHSRRVAGYCAEILRELTLSGPDADLILASARVHDIGKIGVPDYVLNKPGPLTDEERAIMESHPTRGADLLRRYPDFARGVDIVRYHHERWDGRGYPAGLKGTAIPLGARIIAVADSFDAMTSDRAYRPGMPAARALEILRHGAGTQWDVAIVTAFLRYAEQHAAPEASQTPEALPALVLVGS